MHIPDFEERKTVQSLPNEEIIPRMQQERPDGKEVVAIRKRPSEDHRLFPTGERTRAAVLQDRSWITCSGQSCSIVENTYKVLDHSIPVDCQREVQSFETLCCFTKCLRIYGTRLSLSSKTQISTGK
jgi:hypothetical protein